MKRLAVLAVAVLAGCGGGSSEPPASTPSAADERLQRALDGARRDAGIPGVSAAVLKPGREPWFGVSGVADATGRTPVTPATLFAAGSVTKPLVAALALRLQEEGRVDLDDRLAKWFPRYPNAARIRLRQLLDHTAGLADFLEDPAFFRAQERAGDDTDWKPERTLGYARTPRSEPGKRWRYSNTGYVLAGLVIERVTGESLGAALHRHLLDREAFPRVLLQGDDRVTGPVATGHQAADDGSLERVGDGGRFLPDRTQATTAWAAGGVAATAGDLARALDAMLAGDVLSEESKAEMTRWVPAEGPPEYGLGLGRDELNGAEVWGHNGNTTGFHAEAWFFPGSGTTVVVLANAQFGDRGPRQDAVVEALARAVP